MTASLQKVSDATSAEAIIDELRLGQQGLRPFDPAILSFAAELSRRLRRWGQREELPAVTALAYWIRPANIERLQQEWNELADRPGLVHQPRGVAFHIPPTNVDTLFVYSWLLSALAGNANAIRIAPSSLDTATPFLAQILETLEDHPAAAKSTQFLTYSRNDAITAALSQADVRLIWGGDETVHTIRAIPCAPRTVELAFADRFSFAVINASAVVTVEAAKRVASGLFNDAYWFDQMGCASPRAITWLGNELESELAADLLWKALDAELKRRSYGSAEGVATAKLLDLARSALAGDLDRAQWLSGELAVGDLNDGAALRRDAPGGGLFYTRRIESLKELTDLVDTRDQTLAQYGFEADQLVDLAQTLGAAGIDRIVPIGSALNFDRFWDGHDLLHSLTRIIRIS